MTAPVFSSDIKRIINPNVSQLYELLCNTPANYVIPERTIEAAVAFQPKTGKIYVPKTKTNTIKVKTVANIRQLYEDEVFSYLPEQLLKSERYFLSKLSNGSTRFDGTKRVARKILKTSSPIDRQTWQILTNLNPNGKLHPLQNVLWNGVCLRVNGSYGGNTKFLINWDLNEKKIIESDLNRKSKGKKRTLLQKSLSVKFKPGPLKMKKSLDYSHQKFNVGSTELIKLPQIGLIVQPLYGVPIEPTISQVLFSLSAVDGMLTDKWAEFSVSALGKITGSKSLQLETSTVVFDLNYKNDQNQILMRSDQEIQKEPHKKKMQNYPKSVIEDDFIVTQQINILLMQMLESIEINITQDKYLQYDPDDRITTETELSLDSNGGYSKDKLRKKYGELEKLDITVIRLPDVEYDSFKKACEKPFCSYGCICISLEYEHKLKQHCGKSDCMFKCNCDVSKLKQNASFNDNLDILPGLINLDDTINAKLAKEEQKFHQTVLLTENKSYILKPQRRSTKIPKKYSEFFTDRSKEIKISKIATINLRKLPCDNIEPWCMVHNLYKCFCRGRFTKTSVNLAKSIDSKMSLASENLACTKETVCEEPIFNLDEDSCNSHCDEIIDNANASLARHDTCARVRRYRQRRYDFYHYEKTHRKIAKLEENDKSLNEKLLKHIKSSLQCESAQDGSITSEVRSKHEAEELSSENNEVDVQTVCKDELEQSSIPKNFPDMTKLIKWLEENYKFYKPRLQNGQKRFPLESPRPGKIALYPWEVILERYNSKKNYFLITISQPYRIFLAVDLLDPVFKNCINIDEVKFQDISKYPITVRNLLQDASDMKDSFYILCGQLNCWELIGHVTKLEPNSQNNNLSLVSGGSEKQLHVEIEVAKYDTGSLNDLIQKEEKNKWFLMMVGNDFKEIQFINRGFFIKYENIQKAIKVARLSNKTVRLSSQKSGGFGIHAVPIKEHDYVFIGPYGENESLGFETIGFLSDNFSTMTSKGIWINTEKTSHIDLINNPTLFIKNTCERLGKDLENLVCDLKTIKAQSDSAFDTKSSSEVKSDCSESCKKRRQSFDTLTDGTPLAKVVKYDNEHDFSAKSDIKESIEKVVKPITIKKSGSFYKVLSKFGSVNSSLLGDRPIEPPLAINVCETKSNLESFVNPYAIPIIQNTFSLSETSCNGNLQLSKTLHNKPVAEIAPQMKTDLLPKSKPEHESELKVQSKFRKNGMFILNPEEINKLLLENKLNITSSLNKDTEIINETTNEEMDVENFLTTHSECQPSDEEGEAGLSEEEGDDSSEQIMEVVVECKDYDIGWIPGKINQQYQLSFALPGFKFTEFYNSKEAFTKINQVLSRKVYIPKDIKLEWEIIYRKHTLLRSSMLRYDIDFKKLLQPLRKLNKTKSSAQLCSTVVDETSTSKDIVEDQQERKILEDESQETLKRSVFPPKTYKRLLKSSPQPPSKDVPVPSTSADDLLINEENDLESAKETTKVIKDLEAKSVSLENQVESLQSTVLLKQSELLRRLSEVPTESIEKMRQNIFNIKK